MAALRRVLPSLQQAEEHLHQQLLAAEASIEALEGSRVQQTVREAVERFVAAIHGAVEGSGAAVMSTLGQSLDQEESEGGGPFAAATTHQSPAGGAAGGAARPPNAHAALSGGAQFRRLLDGFRIAIHTLPEPEVRVIRPMKAPLVLVV